MKIEELLADSHRATAVIAAKIMIKDAEAFQYLIDEVPKQNPILAMRITRAIAIAHEVSPETVNKFAPQLLNILLKSDNQKISRGILKLFQEAWKILDEDKLGQLLDVSFNYLEDPAAEIAARVYAMVIIYEGTTIYPEIKNELESIIEFHYEEGSPAFKAVGRKILKKLRKKK